MRRALYRGHIYIHTPSTPVRRSELLIFQRLLRPFEELEHTLLQEITPLETFRRLLYGDDVR